MEFTFNICNLKGIKLERFVLRIFLLKDFSEVKLLTLLIYTFILKRHTFLFVNDNANNGCNTIQNKKLLLLETKTSFLSLQNNMVDFYLFNHHILLNSYTAYVIKDHFNILFPP